MFEKHQARTMVHRDVTDIQPGEFKFFRELPPLKELEEHSEFEGKSIKPATKVPESREEILALYGDPSQNKPVLATDDAPEPFKGLQAALHAGDEELAFQYARQYSRYMQDLKTNNEKVMGFLATAQRREGFAVEGDWTSSDAYKELAHFLEDEEDQGRNSFSARQPSYMTESDMAPAAPAARIPESRQEIRTMLASRQIPRGVKGPINVYFFFNYDDLASQKAAAELEKLHSSLSNGELNLIGMSIKDTGQQELEMFRRRTGVSFPLNNGSMLAKNMDMNVAPTAVFMHGRGGEPVFEEGLRNFMYYDELIKLMRQGS